VRNRLNFPRLMSWIAGALFAPMFASTPFAGPVIIGGTDAEDHGNATASANQDGWLFLQRAFEGVAGKVTNGQKTVVCLGCNNQAAANAFFSAFDKSSLPAAGWVRRVVVSSADFGVFFSASLVAGTTNIFNTGVIYMPSDRINALGGITEAQLDLVNAQSAAISAHVSRGGGLFTQTQSGVANGFGWLKALIPGLTVSTDRLPETPTLELTAQSLADFPNLTATALGSAAQWHNYFGGPTGGLKVLGTGTLTAVGAGTDGGKAAGDPPVILGGGDVNFAAPVNLQAVPVGGAHISTLLAALMGCAAFAALRRRRTHAART
jgi:hypothetical protein